MLEAGSKTVGAWMLLVIAIFGWAGVGMEVVHGGQHAGHSQEGLAT